MISLLLPIVVLVHLLCSPFTKVEESFNIQATHDILNYGIPLRNTEAQLTANYDHMTFPGSVPRTFVGALALAEISRPWARWLSSPLHAQLMVRGILGLGNSLVLLSFQHAVKQAFGSHAANWYILMQASQFHVMYYASRTLPNMFAFGFTTMALRYAILAKFGPRIRRAKRCRHIIYYLTLGGIIFRSELAILLTAQTVTMVLARRTSLTKVIVPAGLTAAAIAIVITITVDSFFWQQFPIWPEWIAFLYNTVQGKSADWGTSPWHFYFTNSIPRLMFNPFNWLVCIPIAMTDRSLRKFSIELMAPLLAFIAIYSLLPHKEWRFIIYAVPGMTAVASAGASWIWTRRSRSVLNRMLCLALILSTLLSFAASACLLAVSSLNYPGAEALNRLHDLVNGTTDNVAVHLDILTCQTGVTRFLQIPQAARSLSRKTKTLTWTYDKTEDPAQLLDPLFWERFDYVLAEHPELVIGNWEVIGVVDGFAGLSFSKTSVARDGADAQVSGNRDLARSFWVLIKYLEEIAQSRLTKGWWLRVRMVPKIRILKREPGSGIA